MIEKLKEAVDSEFERCRIRLPLLAERLEAGDASG
jgi:hypothetical protein